MVRYGSELALPVAYTVTVDEYRYAVRLDVAVDNNGPRVASVMVTQAKGGPAVTTEGLRGLPLARLLRVSVDLAAWGPLRDREGNVVALTDAEGNVVVDDEGYI